MLKALKSRLKLSWLLPALSAMWLLAMVLGYFIAMELAARPAALSQWSLAAEGAARNLGAGASSKLSELGASFEGFASKPNSASLKKAREYLSAQPLGMAIYWMDDAGRVHGSVLKDSSESNLDGFSFDENPQFLAASGGAKGWSRVFMSAATRAPSIAWFEKTPAGFIALEIDASQLAKTLAPLAAADVFWSYALVDSQGQALFKSSRGGLEFGVDMGSSPALRPGSAESGSGQAEIGGVASIYSTAALAGTQGWRSVAYAPRSLALMSLEKATESMGLGMLALSLISFAAALLFSRWFSGNLKSFSKALLAWSKDPGKAMVEPGIPKMAYSEFHDLLVEFKPLFSELEAHRNSLQELAESRSAKLDLAHERLRGAYEELAQAQESLLESSKLAALGGMVAGLSHELNTPIGNAHLSASALGEELSEMISLASKGGMGRKEFEKRAQKCKSLADISCSALSSASLLIKSFKRVSQGQSTQGLSSFCLKALIHDAMSAFTVSFANKGVEWSLSGEDFNVVSEPGLWTQLIGNLCSNAIVHGFESRGGKIVVKVLRDRAGAKIHFEDDGVGMSPEVRQRAFDPFFTTKPGNAGCSGLGLHLCHQIAAKGLCGSLELWSEKGRGCKFVISSPLDLSSVRAGDAGAASSGF